MRRDQNQKGRTTPGGRREQAAPWIKEGWMASKIERKGESRIRDGVKAREIAQGPTGERDIQGVSFHLDSARFP